MRTIWKFRSCCQKRDQHTRLTWPNRPARIKKAAFCQECRTLQCKLREIQNEWWTNLAVTTQLCADTGDYRGFYKALKAVYGPSYQILSPLRSADGKELLTEKNTSTPSSMLAAQSKNQRLTVSYNNQ